MLKAVLFGMLGVLSFNASAQQRTPPLRLTDQFELKTQDPNMRIAEEPRTMGLLEVGKIREFGFRLRASNDFIVHNDEGNTHNLNIDIEGIGDHAIVGLHYGTRLFTSNYLPEPQTGQPAPVETTKFKEVTDLTLGYLSRPDEDGLFRRFELGAQSFGDDLDSWGGRQQQQWFHSAGLGSQPKEYDPGTTREYSAIAKAGLGYFNETESGGLYCRGECTALLNTEWERAYVRISGDAGITLIENDKKRPIVEALMFVTYDLYTNKDQDLLVSPINLRGTLEISKRFSLDCLIGLQKPLVEPDQYQYTDGNWLLSANISMGCRF